MRRCFGMRKGESVVDGGEKEGYVGMDGAGIEVVLLFGITIYLWTLIYRFISIPYI